jgi:hypothetical protein
MDELEPIEDTPEPWEKRFFEAYLNDYGVVGKAANAAGVHPNKIKARAKESPAFKLMYEAAERAVNDMLDFEVMRRALEPSERPVYQRGKLVGVIREWDNRHLEWVAERRMPQKYHLPTRVEFAGDADGAIAFKLELNPGSQEEDREEG